MNRYPLAALRQHGLNVNEVARRGSFMPWTVFLGSRLDATSSSALPGATLSSNVQLNEPAIRGRISAGVQVEDDDAENVPDNPTSLTQEEALTRIQSLLGDLKQQQGDQISDLKEEWQGNRCTFSFKAKGFSTSGTLTVTSTQAELRGSLPFAALPLGRIESEIRQRAEQLLS